MIGLAMLIGIAKPIPSAVWATAVLMPTTSPCASRRAPPELPGLIAASVWMRLLIWVPSWTWMVRPNAEMIPAVTEFVYVPSGLPMAIASWPTFAVDEFPIGAVGSPVASTFTIARSVNVSIP